MVLLTLITSAPASRISSTASSRTAASNGCFRIGDAHPDTVPLGRGRASQYGQLGEVLLRFFARHALRVGT